MQINVGIMKKTIVLLFIFSICYARVPPQEFGKAFECYLTGEHEQALVLSRKLYERAPQEKRIQDLYYKCLKKIIKKHEEKQDYKTALDYIKEAEKIDTGEQIQEIKKRILATAPKEILDELKKEDKIALKAFSKLRAKRIKQQKKKHRQERKYDRIIKYEKIIRVVLWTLISILYTLLIGYLSYIIWKKRDVLDIP